LLGFLELVRAEGWSALSPVWTVLGRSDFRLLSGIRSKAAVARRVTISGLIFANRREGRHLRLFAIGFVYVVVIDRIRTISFVT
jgi:hypothetical protein